MIVTGPATAAQAIGSRAACDWRDAAALVTGGASGIGAATVRRLAAEGARVAVADLNEDGAREIAGEVDGAAVVMDVLDNDSVAAGVDAAIEAVGAARRARQQRGRRRAGTGLLRRHPRRPTGTSSCASTCTACSR